ncbi:chemotaxis protein CheW [Oceanobacillus caeni]|uniref:Chemotaxis protein CheW n=1 Tax=Oceanobacillus caeni TaxID=405946 RepID=A0ABR5ML59_9BACI|nr:MULTISPECIES: chemotaxis protein CheW [Bacillaceae]KKE79698.1 chemotaxis protein CheW [Bacilli bacterium VT-13-104]PZD89587.1 chemotaxis protein CheW [Bacilli bacterium]KPH76673.1 chemotaxis protein CheW [Oceanobacillus caeni]MBU8789175.1 chemotaxis protein CheW [Oceanobacillus caeni]MCR1833341.1 chemotaxis protein CheW [Oceanobacillus caeni]
MDEMTKYIIFKLQNQSFGVDVQQIISIERIQEITEVPRTSEFIKGVTHIRGETTPVVDLRERLLMEQKDYTDSSRILVVQIKDMQIGLIVDAATEVKDINQELIKPAPSYVGGVKDTFVSGVANLEDGLLIILDLETIINLEETNELQEVID